MRLLASVPVRPAVVLVFMLGCTGAPGAPGAPGAHRAGDPAARDAAAAQPVVAATARARAEDVAIELDGIGTVTPQHSVLVRPQLDARLDAVAFTEGQDVAAGQLLARLDARPYQAAHAVAAAALARDRASAHHDAQVVERTAVLRASLLVPQQQLDDARELAAQSAAAEQLSAAQLQAAAVQLDYTRITSPIAGRAGLRLVDPGNVVHASDSGGLVVINQIDPIAVWVTLPAASLPQIVAALRRGKLAALACGRAGTGAAPLARGEVWAVDNAINPNTATIRLKAGFANPDGALWPSQFLRVRLAVDTLRGAVVVPAAAIGRGPSGAQAWVVGAGRHVHAVALPQVRILGERAVVDGALAPGDEVVVDGQHLLRDGSVLAVSGRQAAAPAAHAAPGGDAAAPGGAAAAPGSHR